MFLNFVTEECF